MQAPQDVPVAKRRCGEASIEPGFGERIEPADTPLVSNGKLSSVDCPTETGRIVLADECRWYVSTVASLIYLSYWTRPDIAYAVTNFVTSYIILASRTSLH